MPQTPKLAILGAGPTGLDAALAASEMELNFNLYEAGEGVARYIRQWGHVRLFSPWDLDLSPRIRRALTALGRPVPTGADCPTGEELVERAFQPVAESPHIAPSLRLATRVVAIGREGLLKHQAIGDPIRAQHKFRILVERPDGIRGTETADFVLDCTGTYGQPNVTGDGGIPAPGERSCDDRIVRTIPDVFAEPEIWAGKRILLVGAGHSAQTAVVDFATLAEQHPETEIVWAIRREIPEWTVIEDDPLPDRAALVQRAEALAQGSSVHVRCVPGVVVDSIREEAERMLVALRGHDGSLREELVDTIVSLTGFSGDTQLYRQLQVHECYATSGPMKLAASLLAQSSVDCLAQTSQGAEVLKNPEPGFFILGSKSYGRNTTFLMRVGWQQVDEVFGLIDAGRRNALANAHIAG